MLPGFFSNVKDEEKLIGNIFITACHPAITVIKEIKHQNDFLKTQNKKKKIRTRRR
jgi:hypothetical protein